ncbi:MAG: PepSY-associated TM helix domain-containing protein [Pseudomonadota bacterium]
MKAAGRTLHLWLGLISGSFFVVLGLTGSAMAWIHELDRALNPDLLQVAPPPGMAAGTRWRLEPAMVERAVARLRQDAHYGQPTQLMFPEHAGDVFVAWYTPAPNGGSPWTQTVQRQVMLDPTTLVVTGERNWGEAGLSRPLLMPTVYHLHLYLVAGETGKTLVGIFGLCLLVVALSGLVLWWPKMTRSAVWKAITVRHGGSWPRFSFRLHTAAGFFAAPVLLTMGFSGSYFNLPAVVVPVLNVVAPVSAAGKVVNRRQGAAGSVSPGQAVGAAQAAFPLARASRLSRPAKPGVPYEVRVRQPGEVRGGDGATRGGRPMAARA